MKKGYTKSTAILILSCDKYQDLWKPFFHQFRKYWPNCPYRVYLGTNTTSYEDKRVQVVRSGEDKDWSSSLLSILMQIPEDYVFLWLDDIFPIIPIQTAMFDLGFDYMDTMKANHIHMQPKPIPDQIPTEGTFGTYKPGAPYRVNVLGFWRVQYLRGLLLKGESPWNFEVMGSYRSMYDDGFYCFMKPVFPHLHLVEKGKFFPEAVVYAQKHDIPLDLLSRETLKAEDRMKSYVKAMYFNQIMKIPWSIRVHLMNFFRKVILSY